MKSRRDQQRDQQTGDLTLVYGLSRTRPEAKQRRAGERHRSRWVSKTRRGEMAEARQDRVRGLENGPQSGSGPETRKLDDEAQRRRTGGSVVFPSRWSLVAGVEARSGDNGRDGDRGTGEARSSQQRTGGRWRLAGRADWQTVLTRVCLDVPSTGTVE